MKKTIIAGAGVAAFAFAAFPFAGVFADGTGDVTTSTVDTLTLTVSKGCSITTTTRSDVTAAFGSVVPGQTATDGTSPFTVTCNDAWSLTPSVTTALSNGSASIPSGATALDGSVSEWALKLTVPAGPTNAFSDFEAVNGTNAVVGNAAVSDIEITPQYKVSVAAGQATGNYSGTVTYNVTTTNQ